MFRKLHVSPRISSQNKFSLSVPIPPIPEIMPASGLYFDEIWKLDTLPENKLIKFKFGPTTVLNRAVSLCLDI
jgi:hypothetical protein